jgi:photosystem II stability/assembly factor-like uncharacterized protein
MSRIVCFWVFFISIFPFSYAQTWFENGKDDQGNPNFFLIQKEAEKYFQSIDITEKGVGFKPYKRWEENWKDRIYEDGSFPDAGINERNFNEYLKTVKNQNRSLNIANWTNLGPNSTPGGYAGLGRINCVAFHPTNANIIWVGSPGGGLWKSTDGGMSWTTNFDNSVVLGVSSIVIHPTNPDIMYIATGDGDGSDTNSTGVLKSTDGGVTWQTTGLNWTVSQGRRIRKLLMDPDDTNMLLAATSDGLYLTTNAASTWTRVVQGNFFDVEANPNVSTNTFYAASSNRLYTSTNNGANWTQIQEIASNNRIALGVSPHNPNVVYALCSKSTNSGFNGMYKSTNAGTSYSLASNAPNILNHSSTGGDPEGQGWYDLCIAVDPTNANIVYTGGINIWKSTDGGVTWALRTHWSGASGVQTVHADQHALEWQNNTTLWLGNDGGIYRTTNGGVNWTDRSNTLIISQMYRIDVAQQDSKVITGLQDNGTKLRQTNGTWVDRIGGDGMDCHISPTNANVMYASYQNGNFFRSTNGSNFSNMNVPDANNGAWITPLAIDPSNTQNIYVGYNRIHKSTNQGGAWTTISADISSTDLSYLFVAPSNGNILYAGTSGGPVLRSSDGGVNWTTMTSPGGGLQEIAIHPNNPDIIWAVRSNYTAGAKVYKSINGGSTWTNISGNLPNLPVNCIIYQVGSQDGLYIGMDVGVYYIDNTLTNWELYNQGLPNVRVRDLKIKYDTQELYAGTYGRGAWKSPLYDTGGEICSVVQNVNVTDIEVYSARATWISPVNDPAGYEYVVSTNSNPPASGTFTNDTTVVLQNLLSNTNYFVHVRSVCGEGINSAWRTSESFITKTTCDDISTDTGGANGDYSDNENTIRYICPDGPYQQAVLSFTQFAVEPQYDALYVYNGPTINSPLFSSGNPATLSNFPAGGFYGTNLPGPFTSTHPTGCLTLQFRTDVSVVDDGWRGNVTCIDNCTSLVRVTADDGIFSLRNVMVCAENGQTINFDSSLQNDTIKIISPIFIDKNITINTLNLNLYIEADYDGHIFEILPGGSLTLQNIHLIGGKGNTNTRVMVNRGNVNFSDVDILDVKANIGTGKTIDNEGSVSYNNLFEIRTN